jgi:hypothetical protein
VHTAHSNVAELSPLLRSALCGQLAPFSSAAAPLQLQAACFPGCVQLLANVIALPAAAAAATASSGSSTAEDLAAIQSSSFVATLLSSLTEQLKTVCSAGAGLAGQLAVDSAPAVDVLVGGATASSVAAAAAAGNAPNYPDVSLQWCNLACLTVGMQQQLTLHLQLAAAEGAAAGDGAVCRLLCFNSAGVLLDEQVELQQTIR